MVIDGDEASGLLIIRISTVYRARIQLMMHRRRHPPGAARARAHSHLYAYALVIHIGSGVRSHEIDPPNRGHIFCAPAASCRAERVATSGREMSRRRPGMWLPGVLPFPTGQLSQTSLYPRIRICVCMHVVAAIVWAQPE